MKKIYRIENLDCANCAAKLERAIAKLDGVGEASVNFMAQKITLVVEDADAEAVLARVKAVVSKIEPECVLRG